LYSEDYPQFFYNSKRTKKNSHANVGGYPIYLSTLKDKFRALRDDFHKGRLSRLEYLAQRHEFNKLLFEIAQEIKTTEIEKIEIDQKGVLFTFQPFEIKMLSDGGCRSAPLEILNFGSYEKEEAFFVFEAINEGDIIFDVGANLGWYSIQFAKRFKQAIIHAFEPIPQTFSMLQKNIELNNLTNVFLHNFGLGKTDEEAEFFYFKGGSAIASRQNLLENQKASKIECKITSLDLTVARLNLQKLDFLKCDVEGSELDVITGGLQSLKRFLPIIYIELFTEWCQKFGYIPNDVTDVLKEFGYHCFKIQGKNLVQTEEIEDDNDNYNFFFLIPEKHTKFIEKSLKNEQNI
jgi:methyltransferase, FkbM family